MINNMKLYLAHNYASRFKVRDEITPIVQEMYPDYEIVNPFLDGQRHNEGLFADEDSSEKGAFIRFNEKNGATAIDKRSATIVERDLAHVDGCDMIVSYIERASFGTGMEIAYAKMVRNIPVVILMDTNIDLLYHPFLNYYSDEIINLEDKGHTDILTNGKPINLKVLHAFEKYAYEIAQILAEKHIGYKKSASGLGYNKINGRIVEKTLRITSLVAQGMQDDGVEDIRETILDIGGYAILMAMCHDSAFPFQAGFGDITLLDAFTDEQIKAEAIKRGFVE